MDKGELNDIRALMEQIEVEPLKLTRTRYGKLHRAAAVLDYFDPATLKQFGKKRDTLQKLLANCVPLTIDTERYLTLRDGVRRKVLQAMDGPSEMQAALLVNPNRPDTLRQQLLEQYINGDAPAIKQQSLAQLSAAFDVIGWLEGSIAPLPSEETVQEWHARRTLYMPFEKLADRTFTGREDELATLQAYFEAPLEQFLPLNLYGPGGMGKSTLLAKFILNNRDRMTWVYLDFDRPIIQPMRPLTLLIEGMRQIGIQFPEAQERCERLQEVWRDDLSQGQQAQQDLKQVLYTPRRGMDSYAHSFVELVYSLNAPPPPLLFILDTFEQVQRRSPVAVDTLIGLMEALYDAGHSYGRGVEIRIIVSGRAPLQPETDEEDTQSDDKPIISLGEFKYQAAIAFLKMHEMPPDIATFVADNVGCSPLSLRLAIDWWRRKGSPSDVTDLFGDLAELAYEERQGILFRRLLGDLGDKEVERLAFPGLILRRITPELIEQVLAGPCEVTLSAENSPTNLYNRLASEVSLVINDGSSLRHRPDVRAVSLRLMREQMPHKREEIERKAIAYYEKRDDAQSRTEEIYHRLSLGQSTRLIGERWREDIDTESLIDVLDEFGPRHRAWLARRAEVRLRPEEEEAAESADWEHDTKKRIEEWLELQQFDRALRRLAKRPERLPDSPLFALEAEVRQQSGDTEGALAVLQGGIEQSSRAGEFATAIDLAIRIAALAHSAELETEKQAALEQAQRWVDLRDSGPLFQLRIGLLQRDVSAQAQQLVQWFDTLGDVAVIKWSQLMGELAGHVGVEHDHVLWRVLTLTGLEGEQRVLLRKLGWAVAEWDESRPLAGELAKACQIQQERTLRTSWVAFWMDASSAERLKAIESLREFDTRLPQAVRQRLADILAARARSTVDTVHVVTVQTDGKSTSIPPPIYESIRLSGRQWRALIQAITDAFSINELARVMRFGLDVDLETIVLAHSMDDVAFRLIEWAESRDRVGELVYALYEARPTHVKIRNVAQSLLGDIIPKSSEQLLDELQGPINPEVFRQWLSEIEHRICFINVNNVAATGTLIGPNLVLTVYDELATIPSDKLSINVQFDGNDTVYPATIQTLIPASEDTIVVLRLAEYVGYLPIGEETAALESTAVERGWVDITNYSRLSSQTQAAFFVTYNAQGEIKLRNATLIPSTEGTRIRFNNVRNLLAGGLCFDEQLRPTGVVTYSAESRNRFVVAAMIENIVEELTTIIPQRR